MAETCNSQMRQISEKEITRPHMRMVFGDLLLPFIFGASPLVIHLCENKSMVMGRLARNIELIWLNSNTVFANR